MPADAAASEMTPAKAALAELPQARSPQRSPLRHRPFFAKLHAGNAGGSCRGIRS